MQLKMLLFLFKDLVLQVLLLLKKIAIESSLVTLDSRQRKKLGLDFVPVRFMDLTDAEADALAIADNKIGELSKWDEDVLRDLIKDLEDEFPPESLGFSELELEKMFEHTTDWDDFADETLQDESDFAGDSMTAVTVFVENQYKVSATEVIKAALEEYGYEYSFRQTADEYNG